MTNRNNKSVAITGAASGLGRQISLQMAQKGYNVFGTALSQKEIDAFIKAGKPDNIFLTITDITKEQDVNTWVNEVSSSLGDTGLHILINNAGILTPGPMELIPLNDIRKEFEVNVFGSIAVTHAFLPLLRKAKGRILQIGSMSGFFPIPFNGPSSASKATLEALADVYRIELLPFGVDYTLVLPGSMLTDGPEKTAAQLQAIAENITAEQSALYGAQFGKFSKSFNAGQAAGISAIEAAEKVVEIAETNPAPSRATVGQDAENAMKIIHTKTDQELDQMKIKALGLN